MKNILSGVYLLAVISATAQYPAFQWAKTMGGADVDDGKSIAVDGSGNVYTTGYFQGTVDFDPGTGIKNLTSAGFQDIFISKLNATGTLVWAKNIGGSAPSEGMCIAIDLAGNVYTTGHFVGVIDFDPGAGVFNLTAQGFEDIFISKLDANGNFAWAKSMGAPGTITDKGTAIAINSAGDVITTGFFGGTADFDPGAGVFNLYTAGSGAFLLKLDASGNFIWAKNLGEASGQSVTIDPSDNMYITGTFNGTTDFDPGPGAYNLSSMASDAFILKLDASANFIWAKDLGGSYITSGNAIAVDPSGNVYTTGSFQGTSDFDPGTGTFNLTSSGSGNAFISKLDASGNFVWAKHINGNGSSQAQSIAVDPLGMVYTTGSFQGTSDFDPGAGILNLSGSPYANIFILILDNAGNLQWVKNIDGSSGGGQGNSIKLDATGNMYTTGFYNSTCDFDPGTGILNLTSSGYHDIFVHKMAQSSTVGLAENIDTHDIKLYPNPNQGCFCFDLTFPAQVAVINLMGQVIMQFEKLQSKICLDIREQENGIYFLKIIGNNGIPDIQKIIKN